MKILVPTDFSEQSKSALSEAVEWAKLTDGEIQLVHVVGVSYWPRIQDSAFPEFEDLSDTLRCDARERLEALRSSAIGSRVSSKTLVLEGTPHDEIARYAHEAGIDLMVIATHGHSGLKRFLLGSTTERIVRSSPCSVLVVRGSARRGISRLHTILVATDFSDDSLQAVKRAVELAAHRDAEVLLLHVFREADDPTAEVVPPHLWQTMRRRSEQWLEKLRDGAGNAIRSRVLVTEGVPSATIADAAAENHADLIVIGSHGRSAIRHSGLGTTAERVVRVAPCSVFVERSPHARTKSS